MKTNTSIPKERSNELGSSLTNIHISELPILIGIIMAEDLLDNRTLCWFFGCTYSHWFYIE